MKTLTDFSKRLPSFREMALKIDSKEKAQALLAALDMTAASSKTRRQVGKIVDARWSSLR